MLLAELHGEYILHGDQLLPFNSEDMKTINEKNPYGASFIDNDRIAIGTSLGGCFIINKKTAPEACANGYAIIIYERSSIGVFFIDSFHVFGVERQKLISMEYIFSMEFS